MDELKNIRFDLNYLILRIYSENLPQRLTKSKSQHRDYRPNKPRTIIIYVIMKWNWSLY